MRYLYLSIGLLGYAAVLLLTSLLTIYAAEIRRRLAPLLLPAVFALVFVAMFPHDPAFRRARIELNVIGVTLATLALALILWRRNKKGGKTEAPPPDSSR